MDAHRYTLRPDFPGGVSRDWIEELQGVAHDEKNWFLTTRYHLWKFPVTFDLSTHFDESGLPPDVATTGIPQPLAQQFYNHFGDIDCHDGRLYVPLTSLSDGVPEHSRPIVPKLAIFDASSLRYIGSAVLDRAPDAWSSAWCAVHPKTGLLYTGAVVGPPDHAIDVYSVSTGRGGVSATFRNKVRLFDASGAPLTLCDGEAWLQGAAFSPGGRFLHLVCGAAKDHYAEDGVHVIEVVGDRGIRVARSTCGNEPFNFEFHPDLSNGWEEPEGATYWDVSNLSAPGIAGQLHIILYQNFPAKFYFKHYEINPPLRELAGPANAIAPIISLCLGS